MNPFFVLGDVHIPPFTPASVPGLAFWVDANDTTSYTTSGLNLTSITNKATSTACTFTMATLTDSQFGGKPSFRAAAINNFIAFNTGSQINVGGGWNLYSVLQGDTALGGGNLRCISLMTPGNNDNGGGASGGIIAACYGTGTNLLGVYANSQRNEMVRGANQYLYSVRVVSNSGTSSLQRADGTSSSGSIGTFTFNGTSIVLGSTSNAYPAAGTNSTVVGQRWAEVLLYKGVVSAPNDAAIVAYLKAKWAIP